MPYRKSVLCAAALALSCGAVSLPNLGTGVPVQAAADLPAINIDPAAKPARYISEYNLFKDNARQIPNAGLVPYDLNTPLFSDYAEKHRFIYTPPGMPGIYNETEVFEFPPGTVIVKTFGFLHDLRDPEKGERIIETRLLIAQEDGNWLGLPYLWNEDMTDARLAVAGGRKEVSWIHSDGAERNINYIIPNMNQCKQCHENDGKQIPIGPKARHLNKDYVYDTGTENQLVHWSRAGLLKGMKTAPDAAPKVPLWGDTESASLDERARGYLDINCAHCHNPKGPAWTSGLDLSFSQTNPMRIGINKAPVAAGRGSADMRFAIVPGDPDNSFLVHRIESNDPGVMMPQLPRQIVHDEGVALVREWITAMDPDDYAIDDSVSPAFLGVQ